MEYSSPFNSDGVLDDLDAYEAICNHVFRGRLCVQTAEHPLLLELLTGGLHPRRTEKRL